MAAPCIDTPVHVIVPVVVVSTITLLILPFLVFIVPRDDIYTLYLMICIEVSNFKYLNIRGDGGETYPISLSQRFFIQFLEKIKI